MAAPSPGVLVATWLVTLTAPGCTINTTWSRAAAGSSAAATDPPTDPLRPRTWTIVRRGAQCLTRLADCNPRWQHPECAAAPAVHACPSDRDGQALALSATAAIHGPLAGASCAFYAHERDIPGYVKKGPARGPQSSKGARPNGKRWDPPPPTPPTAVPCPRT